MLVNPGLGGRWKNAAHPIDRMTNCGIMLVNTGSGGGWKNAAYPMDRTINRWVRVHSGPRWVSLKGWYPPNNIGLKQHGNMNSFCHYKIRTLFWDIKVRVLCLDTHESKIQLWKLAIYNYNLHTLVMLLCIVWTLSVVDGRGTNKKTHTHTQTPLNHH